MDWHKYLEWFLIGVFGGLGYLVVSLIWNLIFNRAPVAPPRI